MFSTYSSLVSLLIFTQCVIVVLSQGEESISNTLIVPKSYNNLRIPGRRRRPVINPPVPRLKISSGVPFAGPPGPPGPASFNYNSDTPRGPDSTFPSPPLPPVLNTESSINFRNDDNFTENDSPVLQSYSDEVDRGETEIIAVDVAIQIQSIREIDEAEQKIILELDLTVHWKDYDFLPEDSSYISDNKENVTGLLHTFGGVPLELSEFEKLWKPDIFIERVVKVTKPGLLSTPIAVRTIKKASSVIYTTRASVKVDCNMDFQYYPADTQNCFLDIRSYQNDETKMNLRWSPLPGAYLVATDTDDNFDLRLTHVAQRRKKVKDINLDDAVFHVLQIKLSMRRRMSYHVIQTYIPSAFLVFITWLSFLIPEDLIEARIGISMTTLLTLTAMFSAVRENTPIVSYVKAIDIWMVYCIFIVFSTLLEFTFFVWMRNYKSGKRERKLAILMSDGKPTSDKTNNTRLQKLSVDEITTKATIAFDRTAKLFNRFAFGFFVLNFVVFNLIYWPWLFVSSEHWLWSVNSTLNGEPDDTNDGFLDEL